MRLRTNFVSNSSSCSFVILGTNNIDGDKIIELFGEEWYDKIRKAGFVYFGEEDLFGMSIAIEEDDTLETSENSLDELKEKAQKVSELLNIPISEVKLLTGTASC